MCKDWMVVERRGTLRQNTLAGYTNDQVNKRTEVQMRLAGGIGISLINGVPEELVFATFNPIEVVNPLKICFLIRFDGSGKFYRDFEF